MQQIQFYREGIHSYMLLPCNAPIKRDSYETTLLELVDLSGLMQYEIRVVDEVSVLYYKLKYRTSLKQVLGDMKFTLEKMHCIIRSIVEVLYQTESYLLNPDYILWRSDTTFVEVNTGKLIFSYYPMYCENHSSIKDFLHELVQFVDKRDEKVYMYLMDFYNLITNPDCELDQLKGFTQRDKIVQEGFLEVEQISIDTPEVVVSHVKEKDSFLPVTILTLVNLIVVGLLLFEVWTYQYIWVLVITLVLLMIAFLVRGTGGEEVEMDKIMEEYIVNEKETNQRLYNHVAEDFDSEMDESMETTILSVIPQEVIVEDNPKPLCLKSMNPKRYPDLILEKSSVVIGSMERSCDYPLSEKGISRMHAKIIKKEDGLYVLDMNSTNQTYLNEQPLIGGKEYLLNEGDVLSLAGVITFVVTQKQE